MKYVPSCPPPLPRGSLPFETTPYSPKPPLVFGFPCTLYRLFDVAAADRPYEGKDPEASERRMLFFTPPWPSRAIAFPPSFCSRRDPFQRRDGLWSLMVPLPVKV